MTLNENLSLAEIRANRDSLLLSVHTIIDRTPDGDYTEEEVRLVEKLCAVIRLADAKLQLN